MRFGPLCYRKYTNVSKKTMLIISVYSFLDLSLFNNVPVRI